MLAAVGEAKKNACSSWGMAMWKESSSASSAGLRSLQDRVAFLRPPRATPYQPRRLSSLSWAQVHLTLTANLPGLARKRVREFASLNSNHLSLVYNASLHSVCLLSSRLSSDVQARTASPPANCGSDAVMLSQE